MTKITKPTMPYVTKSDALIKLLSRSPGATIDEMVSAARWQPQSVRAFLAQLRKASRTVAKERRRNGETTYRLTA